VLVQVQKHSIFERDDDDLLCTMPIDVITASLGGELEVPTLTGKVNLKIPAGTQTDKVFRLRNKGVKPVRKNNAGDLLCRVQVAVHCRAKKAQSTHREAAAGSMASKISSTCATIDT